jgi:hypothetical protein
MVDLFINYKIVQGYKLRIKLHDIIWEYNNR